MIERCRIGTCLRETRETSVEVTWNLDGSGATDIDTGIETFSHLLTLFAGSGGFDLHVRTRGDLHVDQHHSIEDTGIALGRALLDALGDAMGIARMAHAFAPVDGTLARVVVDLSGRGFDIQLIDWTERTIDGIPADLLEHFLHSLAYEGRFNLHVSAAGDTGDAARAQAIFTALGRALGKATEMEPRRLGQVPSTKGTVR